MSTAHSASDIRIVRKECRSAANAGFDTVVVIRGELPADCGKVRQVRAFAPTGGRLGRFVLGAARIYRLAMRERADIYHFHDPDLLPYGLVMRARGAKVIYDAHEDVPRDILSKDWIPVPMRRLIAAVFEAFENFAARRMNAVVAATPHIGHRLREVNPRTVTVNNYPFSDELASSAGERVDTGQTRAGFCYVGGISTIRGAREMLEAIRISELALRIAGPIETEALRRQMESHDGWRFAEYLGVLDRKAVSRLMSESVAGLVLFHPEPNHVNAQPNKLFEYMSAGIPVIASHFPLWRDIVERFDCGICVDPLDPAEIADAMLRLAGDPALARRMGRNGRTAVLERFNWEQEQGRLLQLYRELSGSAA